MYQVLLNFSVFHLYHHNPVFKVLKLEINWLNYMLKID